MRAMRIPSMRFFIPILFSAVFSISTIARAAEPVVFISSFAPGEKGAIHAFRFDAKSGALQPLERTTGIRNPFFLAISPDKRFFYAIDAEKFGGPAKGFVTAYAIEGDPGRLKRL